MSIRELLERSREIWGKQTLTLSEVIPKMGTVFGDICRWERNAKKDSHDHTEEELKAELGHMIYATMKWCDDLGHDPEECIELAIESQEKFVREGNEK
jgi:hypothetical protein